MNELNLLYLLRMKDKMKGQKLKKYQIERCQLSCSWCLHKRSQAEAVEETSSTFPASFV